MIAGSDEDKNRRELMRLGRIEKIKTLYIRGVPMFRIAQQLGITAAQARKDVRLLRRHMQKMAEKAESMRYQPN